MKGKNKNGNLPEGWTETPLLDLLTSLESGKRPRGGVRGISEGVPSLGGEHLDAHGGFDFTNIKYVPGNFASSMKRGHLQKGDVLIVKDGATTGKVALVGESFPFDEAVANEHLFVCRPARGASPNFLATFLRSPDGQRRVLNHFQGSAQGGINQTFATGTVVPVPPLVEQRRIAERIDEIEGRSTSIDTHLQVARTGLDRLRGATLAAACSGRLTEDWREQHPDGESVEGTLADAASLGKKTKRNSESPVKLALPELPNNYLVATVGEIATHMEYGTSKRCDVLADAGIPILRMGNIQAGRLDISDLRYRRIDGEIEGLLLQDGDLLFNRTNSPELVGKSAVFHASEQMSFASYLIRVRFAPDVVNPDFANYWLNSSYGREWARLAKTDGVSQSNINGTKLSLMPIPLPPLNEQVEIVRRATAVLETADRLADQIERTDDALDRLSRAVLAKAFRGELVPTEAELAAEEGRNYETAEELLARVADS
jgi:type I restriction enzyme S subunit